MLYVDHIKYYNTVIDHAKIQGFVFFNKIEILIFKIWGLKWIFGILNSLKS
jgi:hypothetical protein